MGRFSSMSTAVSGMQAAQAGLYVTGHNMSNLETRGYTRQQTLQSDFFYNRVGTSQTGINQVGLGTNQHTIRQIRDRYLDLAYRKETPKLSFYDAKYKAGEEIENIFGELESDYRTQTVVQDFWDVLNELSIYPEGLETRGEFISTAVIFIDKANNVYDRLRAQQNNLNDQVKSMVSKINKLTEDIEKYNRLISKNEATSDNANDYRDARNAAIDELSNYLNINYNENLNGTVDVYTDGKQLISNGFVRKLGLRYTAPGCSLVEPVFTSEKDILEVTDTDAIPLYNVNEMYNNSKGGDLGGLKGLLVSRGYYPTNYSSNPAPTDTLGKFNVEQCLIPGMMKKFDTLVNKIVTMVNDLVAPYTTPGLAQDTANAPYDLEGMQSFQEIFTRKNIDRFSGPGGTYVPEDPNNPETLYSIGNITINPFFLNTDNLDKIALSRSSTEVGNNKVVLEILDAWKTASIPIDGKDPLNIENFYNSIISNLGVEINEAKKYVDEQQTLIQQLDNKRQTISGVSLDEEMQNMMIYQHAYNASSRLVNVIDSMIETIINM